MATVANTIAGSLRRLGVIGAGKSPRPDDTATGIEALQGIYYRLINNGSFGRLSNITPVPGNFTAQENQRIFRMEGVLVQLPTFVANFDDYNPAGDGTSDYGMRNGCPRTGQAQSAWPSASQGFAPSRDRRGHNQDHRLPRDLSVIVINDMRSAKTQEYIYDAQVAQWIAIHDLRQDDEAPLSRRDPLGLQAMLIVEIAGEYGMEPSQMTMFRAAEFQSALVMNFSQPSARIELEWF